MAHKIYAGSDMYLMPSHLEPCGISQMIAMRYGSIPVVRQVGGLKDSVIAYNEYTKEGTGFGFRNSSRDEFVNILRYAKSFYEQPKVWKNIVDQAMNADYSWSASSKMYKEMYEELCK
jgi:starch synthase